MGCEARPLASCLGGVPTADVHVMVPPQDLGQGPPLPPALAVGPAVIALVCTELAFGSPW